MLLLYTLFIVEIKTGKMPSNIGATVNKIVKEIVEKERWEKRERKENGRLVVTNRYKSSEQWKTLIIERFCIPNFGMIFDCAFPKKARSEKRYFQCFTFLKSDSTSFPRVVMQNKMESVEEVEQDQIHVRRSNWVQLEDEDGLMVDQVIQQLKTRLANYCLVLSVGSMAKEDRV